MLLLFLIILLLLAQSGVGLPALICLADRQVHKEVKILDHTVTAWLQSQGCRGTLHYTLDGGLVGFPVEGPSGRHTAALLCSPVDCHHMM